MKQRSEQRWLIVGLGNPGSRHRHNRHNAGFMFLDLLAEALGASFTKKQFQNLTTHVSLEGQKAILAKPQTYMNGSGRAVGPLARYYEVPSKRLVVAYDDLDLPLGNLQMRPEGGSAGHKGMRSIIQRLDSRAFPRLRIGIGRPPGRMDPADYVLQDFKPDEVELIEIALRHAESCVRTLFRDGIERAMTHCNSFSV
jgi:PTH1 family peptidyl-tRNA hydrolase